MRHTLSLILFAALCLARSVDNARAAEDSASHRAVPTAIVNVDYVDTSGELRDETQRHRQLAEDFKRALERDLAASGKYRLVAIACPGKPCSARTDPFELQKAACAANAKLVVVVGFHKMSTLIQWTKVQIVDESTGHVVFDRLLTFRGDTDDAWHHAEVFVFREIMAWSPAG